MIMDLAEPFLFGHSKNVEHNFGVDMR